jgi:hypothetical protein
MIYNIKLLFSPIKWLGCLVLVLVIPIAMYVPTYYDFVNVSSIYLPFVGIVLFADIALLDKGTRVDEITYLSSKKPINTFIQRFLLSLALLCAFAIIANAAFRVIQQSNGDAIAEPISFFEYIAIVISSSLFFASLSMTISAILNNIYIGYGLSIIYWLYWNVNCQKQMLFNPFSFIANPTFYEIPLIAIYSFTFLLILTNCFLCKKSPFYLPDRLRRLVIR